MASKFVMKADRQDKKLLLISETEAATLKFSTTAYTVAMWYKLVSDAGYGNSNRPILADEGGSNAYTSSISLSDQTNGYFFGNRPAYTNNYDAAFVVKQVVADKDRWYHLALTFNDQDGLRMFVDGELVSGPNTTTLTSKKSGQCGMASKNLSVGGSINPEIFYFDDVCIINDRCLWKENFTPPDKYLQEYIGDIDKDFINLRIY